MSRKIVNNFSLDDNDACCYASRSFDKMRKNPAMTQEDESMALRRRKVVFSSLAMLGTGLAFIVLLVYHRQSNTRQYEPEVRIDLAQSAPVFCLTSDRPPDQQQEIQRMIGEHPAVMNLTDRLDLRELLFVLQRADMVVICDTGPIHMALGVGSTPLVALFGPTPGTQLLGTSLARGRHIILTPTQGCRACGYRLRRKCLHSKHAQCMGRFEVEDIARAVGRMCGLSAING